MTSKATTVEQYFKELPEDRLKPMQDLRHAISTNLPEGFTARDELWNDRFLSGQRCL